MLPIYIATSDKTQFILKLSSKIWNRRIGFDCKVLGYNWPEVPLNLPPNFEFIRLADDQGGAVNWGHFLRKYLETIDDEYIIFLLDDYLVKAWHQENFDKGFEIMKADKDIVRYELNDFSKFSLLPPNGGFRDEGGVIYLNRNASYRVSCQPAVWRVDWLLKSLSDGYTPQLFEVKGSKARANDGKDVISVNYKPAMEWGRQSCWSNTDHIFWKGKLNRTGTHPDDQDLIEDFAKLHSLQIHPPYETLANN